MDQASLKIILAVALPTIVSGKNALNIPRVNTPAPGEWPQSNVTGCGFPGVPYATVLSECTEPMNPSAPDLRGYWKDESGEIGEGIEMCGSRWTDISKPVIHDFPECTGVVGDELGCMDYSGPDIIGVDGLCSPIVVACKFELNDMGQKCVNLYVPNPTTGSPDSPPVKIVSRCLREDGSMVWVHPLFGTTVYTKVPKDEEPNCVRCVGGNNDGVTSYKPEESVPCPYEERQWLRCEEKEHPEQSNTPGNTQTDESTSQAAQAKNKGLLMSISMSLLIVPALWNALC